VVDSAGVRLRRHSIPISLGIFGFLALLYAYFPLINSGPGEYHSLLLIEHGAKTPWWRFWDIPLAEGPRFLMYASFVLQFVVAGSESSPYYIVNLLLVWTAGIFVGLFCYRITASAFAATLSAMLFWMYDSIYLSVAWLPSRQEPMAIIFGISALLLVMRPKVGWAGMLGSFVLLCLSVFSKEYGLVFVAGVAWYALAYRRDLLVPIWSICVAVAGLLLFARQATAVGVYQDALQCEEMGYLWSYRRVCTTIDLRDPANVAQLAWNVGVGLVAQVLPLPPGRLFTAPYTGHGELVVHMMRPRDWLLSALMASLFVVSIVKRMPFRSLCLIMILANAVLSAPYFRTRNVIFGYISTTAIFAYGAVTLAALILPWIKRSSWRPSQAAVSCIPVALCLAIFAAQMHRLRGISQYESALKSSTAHVCSHAQRTLDRDMGAGTAVREDLIEAILTENGIDYTACREP
jgi:hypothetical protein